jgi:hypothetical protein
MTPPGPSQVDHSVRAIWRRYRRGGELRPLVCLAVTVAITLLLAGAAVSAGWIAGMIRGNPDPLAPRAGDVREGDIKTALVVAAVLWAVALFWVWRPAVRLDRHSLSVEQRREWGRPFAITVVIGAVLSVVSYVVHRQMWDDTEYAVTGLMLIGAGVAAVLWLPAVFRLEHGRPVIGPEGRVNVHCPECGYSMCGLREAVCPECGRVDTIDGLIRAQGYVPHVEKETDRGEEDEDAGDADGS